MSKRIKEEQRVRTSVSHLEGYGGDANALKLWLEGLDCGHFFDAFKKEKFVDLETVACHLRKENLNEIGAKGAEIIKVMSATMKLREKLKGPTPSDATDMAYPALRTVTSTNEDELSFKEGDLVILVERTASTKWKGQVNGKEGFFPSDAIATIGERLQRTERLQSLPAQERSTSSAILKQDSETILSSVPKPKQPHHFNQVANNTQQPVETQTDISRANQAGSSASDKNLEGTAVEDKQRVTESENSELTATPEPSTITTALTNSDSPQCDSGRDNSTLDLTSQDNVQHRAAESHVQSRLDVSAVGDDKEYGGTRTDSGIDDKGKKSVDIESAPADVQLLARSPQTPSDTIGMAYPALRTVTSTNEDELSFKEGDLVILVERTDSTKWKGQVNGKECFFPSDAIATIGERLQRTERLQSLPAQEGSTSSPMLTQNSETILSAVPKPKQPHHFNQMSNNTQQPAETTQTDISAANQAGSSASDKNLEGSVVEEEQRVTKSENSELTDTPGPSIKTTVPTSSFSPQRDSGRDKSLSDMSSQGTAQHRGAESQSPSDVPDVGDDKERGDTRSDSGIDDKGNQSVDIGSSTADVPLLARSPQTPELEGIAIEFNVLIHPEWKFDHRKGHQVLIFFGHSWLGEWKQSPVAMEAGEMGPNRHLKLKGRLQLPPTLVSEPIAYKYVVCQNKPGVVFEYLRPPTHSRSKVVNRVLEIPKSLQTSQEGVYRKYDDVIRQERSFVGSLADKLLGSRYVDNRTVAIEAMLPKWRGFGRRVSLEKSREMTAEDFLHEMDHVIQSISRLRVWEDKLPTPTCWEPEGFGKAIVSKAVQKHSIGQLSLLCVRREHESGDQTVIVSSLATAVLVHKYRLEVTAEQLGGLLSAMALLTDADSRTCPGYLALQAEFKDPRIHADAVQSLCMLAISARPFAAEWLLALPLLHFLRGDSAPFQAPPVIQLNTPQWWGLGKLHEGVKSFRESRSSLKAAFSLLARLRSLFDVDPLTCRAFLFVVSLEQLANTETFGQPFEVIYALEEKVANRSLTSSWWSGGSSAHDTMKYLLDVIQRALKHSQESTVDLDGNIEEGQRNAKSGIVTGLRLLRTVAGKFTDMKQLKLILKCRDLVFAMMRCLQNNCIAVAKEIPLTPEDGEVGNPVFIEKFSKERLQQCFGAIEEWLARKTLTRPTETKSLQDDLKIWSEVVQSEFLKGQLENEWTNAVESSLKRQLQNVVPGLLLTAASQLADTDLHPAIEQCFDSIIDKASERLPAMGDPELERLVLQLISGVKKTSRDQRRPARILGDLLERRCPGKMASPLDVLRHLLTWSIWKDILRLIGELPQCEQLLGSGFRLITKATSTLRDTVDRMVNCRITPAELTVITEESANLFELCRRYDAMKKTTNLRHLAESAVHSCVEEQNEYKRQRDLVNNFVAMYASLGIGQSPEVDRLSSTAKSDVSNVPISELSQRSGSGEIIVHYLAVPQNLMPWLGRLSQVCDSTIFLRLWRRQGEQVSSQSQGHQLVAVDEIISAVCTPAFSLWQNLCKSIYEESITLRDVADSFNDCRRNRDIIVRELQHIHRCYVPPGTDLWIKRRATQIEQYGNLAGMMDAARALRRVCNVLKISRPMPEIESVCNQDSEDFKRKPIRVLTETLLYASQFFHTVTEQRVQCLVSFASADALIDWLRDDIKEWRELGTFVELAGAKSSGEGDYEVIKVAHLHTACAGYSQLLFNVKTSAKFPELQSACDKVFAFLERDSQLPAKWLDTGKNLEEFKFMRKSLSSVETSSLSQLSLINSRGVYHVGCIQTKGAATRQEFTMESCVKVMIAAEAGERASTGTVYWLTDLQDLQSKLTLISGKSGESRNEEVKFFFEVLDESVRLTGVFIDMVRAGHDKYLEWKKIFRCRRDRMGGPSQSAGVEGKSHDESALLQSLKTEGDGMKSSLNKWIHEVEQHRSQYYYLNYFTTPQLLVLRRELGSLLANRRHNIPNDVFSLLGPVHPECTLSSVKAALSSVCCSAGTNSSSESYGNVTAFSSGEDAVVRFLHGSQPSGLDGEVFGQISRNETSSYLPIHTLGRFLASLSLHLLQATRRPFPSDYFCLSEPNLLVVPRNEVLLAVLRLYMIDQRLSLPTAQEVLVCCPSTSTEEVCLFWRRAIGDPDHRRLFCLAMADRLGYEVSRIAIEDLNRLVQSRDVSQPVNFRIAIICAAENEDKSYIIDALDAYRRHALPCPSPQNLQKYLKTKLCQSVQGTPAGVGVPASQSAASLDYEGSLVRVVRSPRAGVGKTMFVNMLSEGLNSLPNNRRVNSLAFDGHDEDMPLYVAVPLHDKLVNVDSVVSRLRPFSPSPDRQLSRVFHIDVSSLVALGLDTLLFNLLILGELADSCGHVWRRLSTDMYVVELTRTECWLPCDLTPSNRAVVGRTRGRTKIATFSFVDCLPTVVCSSPTETLMLLSQRKDPGIGKSMSNREFRNADFQRAFQYLKRFAAGANLDSFSFRTGSVEGDHQSFLQVLLQNCGVKDPSWAEMKRFVSFLSNQLRECENNDFCNPEACGEDLPGFKTFVLKLMIRMSRDFATPSLDIERSVHVDAVDLDLVHHQLRRRWEHSLHPYLFFNEDRHSVTFVGVQITRNGQLQDPRTRQILDASMMSPNLSTALYTQGFRLQENYDEWSKGRKIQELSRVMGVDAAFDPDENYELTMDNVKKILAIQMRFRCGIPVVIMGETGCGKTRLIRYMCALQSNLTGARNMILMKIHGGVSRYDISTTVEEAEQLAELNRKNYSGKRIQTVLFFDEANTTDALGIIKEIMCDKRVNGRKIVGLGSSLQVIAACNPYRKHTDQMIRRLEEAGLGYHVKADDTDDRLGQIPLRQLVYRVHELPDSMKALVWDFGQLDPNIEKLYIRQIVSRHVERHQSLPHYPGFVTVVTDIVAAAQGYMRTRNDECSFVSLRDVERLMLVTVWFYNLREHLRPLIIKKLSQTSSRRDQPLNPLTSSVILGLAVCYHARLNDRRPFRQAISKLFREPCLLRGGSEQMDREIRHTQEVFLDELELEPQIARNHALRENVFMMLVCIDLRIPLFLVGKPGSSKSLAKDTIKTAMRGHLSHSPLFRVLKQLDMVSYQCSPLSTAKGILSAFQQCQRVQKDNDKSHFVSCVVLDEVGLAEDSPRLPLKALHPLLDDGTTGAESKEEEEGRANRIAFVGLSNWALDPAKMNRGILVNREEPSDAELIVSAKGICSSEDRTLIMIMPYLEGIAKAYRIIYEKQKRSKEFFGLRDFYSLVKMVFAFCKLSKRPPSLLEMEHAVRRNFGGQDEIDVMDIFCRCCNLKSAAELPQTRRVAIDNSTLGLIQSALEREQLLGESRYMLLLTENYAALNIILQRVLVRENPVIIFGSGFRKDQEYTHICRTIHRIKVCMFTGKTVVLLNLDKLYESLYDALNQYYVWHGGQKFVDLGLGNHRVKCQVHPDFRLILIAEREVVYRQFPIPLINRMEKHFLAMKSVLSPQQNRIVKRLELWAVQFSVVNPDKYLVARRSHRQTVFREGDAFVGYHKDTCATVVLQGSKEVDGRHGITDSIYRERDKQWEGQVFDASCQKLLCCATPDALARLSASGLSGDTDKLCNIYFSQQQHDSLAEFLKSQIEPVSQQRDDQNGLLIQVTTHSRLLSSENVVNVAGTAGVELISLQQFDTEQQFCDRINRFYELSGTRSRVLVVQCEAGDVNNNMIAAARYLVQDSVKMKMSRSGQRHLVLIVQVPRVAGGSFVGFQGGCWIEAHLDELRHESLVNTPSIKSLLNRKLGSLLSLGKDFELKQTAVVAAQGLEGEQTMEAGVIFQSRKVVPMAFELPSQDHGLLNGNALIRACVHAAVSRLDDKVESLDYASRRIHILLELIPNEETQGGSIMFFKELLRRIRNLLQQRDDKMEANSATMWVRNEALSHRSIQAGGTFRRALWLRMVNTITPILSEIVAFFDCNANLQLMSSIVARADNWVAALWIDLFCCSQFGQLRYDDFLSPVQSEMRQRVPVQSTGFRQHLFEARFPFSYLVKSALDEMMPEARTLADSSHERLDVVLQRLVDSSELGEILRSAIINGGGGKNELFNRYLHDFVHMVYDARVQDEQMVYDSAAREQHEVIESAIMCVLNEMAITRPSIAQRTGEIYRATLSPASIHVAFEYVHRRIYSFRDMVRHRRDIVRNVRVQTSKDSPKMVIDTLAAAALLEELSPRDVLTDTSRRRKWLKEMQRAKHVIERWLSLFDGNDQHYGIRTAITSEIRSDWMLLSALRLFVEHVQPLAEDSLVSSACWKFYQCLQSVGIDFTKERTLRAVQSFLHDIHRDFAFKLFGRNSDVCAICLDKWTRNGKNPVKLPCGHIYCCNCIKQQFDRQRLCPTCKRDVPRRFGCQSDDQLKLASENYCVFKRCCTAFFMELVSVYCFSDTAPLPPEGKVVHMLMELVVQRRLPEMEGPHTRPFSPFQEDAIDPRPVVRSFILQLLLKYSPNRTLDYIERVFRQSQSFMGGSRTAAMDLEVIFVHCMEAAFEQRSCRSPVQDRVNVAWSDLGVALNRLRGSSTEVDRLQGIAGVRFGLSVTADIVVEMLSADRKAGEEFQERHQSVSSHTSANPHSAKMLSSKAKEVCGAVRDPNLQLFLLKQLVRSHGMDIMQKVRGHRDLRWICSEQQRQETESAVPDFYVVVQSPYVELREAVARTVIANDTRHLDEVFKKPPVNSSNAMIASVLLALYKEVTMHRASRDSDRQVRPQTLDLLEDYCNRSRFLVTWSKPLAAALIRNVQGRPFARLEVLPGYSIQHHALSGLALHILITFSLPGGSSLMEPLRLFLTEPQLMNNSYFPTMPEDIYIQVKGLVQGTKWYECRNGHPYLVANCGRPVVQWRCTDCGLPIGQGSGDAEAILNDTTQTGHILGPVNRRSDNPSPERDLSQSGFALLRLLLHAVLMWASCSQDQSVVSGVAQIVSPAVANNGLPGFFWSHFEHDVRLFSKGLGRSVEDTVVVCHQLLNRIVTGQGTSYVFSGNTRLTTKEERRAWERAFTQQFTIPMLQLVQANINEWLERVMNDRTSGNSPLMRQIYELDNPAGSRFAPQLWRYRVPVSIGHLNHTIDQNLDGAQPNQCRILKAFLKEESKLRALQYLPDIIKLQRLLVDKYHQRISQQEALTLNVDSFLATIVDTRERQMFEKLIASFGNAWKLAKEGVLNHGRLKPKKKEHELERVTSQTPLAFLLPRTQDAGTCSVALVDYLINCTHNEFLGTYRRIAGHQWEPERVAMEEVTKAHLIAYDLERDLMPLVFAHCDYSLAVGEGTNITYNLPALERQIVDRLLIGKPHIDMKESVYNLLFRKDVYNVALFARVRQRISQEELSLPVQRQIVSELHDLTDVYSVLAVLDIVIGFIVSTGGSSDLSLDRYIHTTLRMPVQSGLVSSKAQQFCQLKHVLSLWRLLNVETGRRLAIADREPFEHVPAKYRDEVPHRVRSKLQKALKKINVTAFLNELVEVITLELSQWEETNNIEDYELGAALQELHGSELDGLGDIPREVQLKHIIACWIMAVKLEQSL